MSQLSRVFTSLQRPLLSAVSKREFSRSAVSLGVSASHSDSSASAVDTTGGVVSNHFLEKTPITVQLWEMRSKLFQANNNNNGNSSTAANANQTSTAFTGSEEIPLLTKTTSESRLSIRYDFASDARLRDLYVNPAGNMIVGKLFEDLDALAGNVAASHCAHTQQPLRAVLVTASVDRIVQQALLSVRESYVMTGRVCWVGKSSLVIALHMFHAEDYDEELFAHNPLTASEKALSTSYFTYVARSRDTGRAISVNRLELVTDEERELFAQRQALVDSKREQSSGAGKKERLSAAKLKGDTLLSRLVEAGSVLEDMPALAHPNAVLMRATALENSLVCQPQNVNTAGRVFGGYIMHKAYDLALATGYTFAGNYPVFLECDRISFRLPVDVGDLLRLKSRVVFTSDDPIQPKVVIEVKCQVINPEKASSAVSNTFSFIFGFRNGVSLRKVLPSTSEEASALLQGSEALNVSLSS